MMNFINANVPRCPGHCSQDLRLSSLDYVNIAIAGIPPYLGASHP